MEDFQGGSRPAPSAPRAQEDNSASSDAADNDAFGIPEMSALRSQFNPRQPAPEGVEQATRTRQTSASSVTRDAPAKHVVFAQPRPPQSMAARNRVEDPRRRPGPESGGGAQESSPASWSTHHEDGLWSPQDSAMSGGTPLPMAVALRFPLLLRRDRRPKWARTAEATMAAMQRFRDAKSGMAGPSSRRSQHIDTEGALFATESLSADRSKHWA